MSLTDLIQPGCHHNEATMLEEEYKNILAESLLIHNVNNVWYSRSGCSNLVSPSVILLFSHTNQ